VSGFRAGKRRLKTEIVGKIDLRKGRYRQDRKKAAAPASAIATRSKVVATGRSMNTVDRFHQEAPSGSRVRVSGLRRAPRREAPATDDRTRDRLQE